MFHAIPEFVNAIAEEWANWMIAASLDSAAILAVVGMVWLALNKRLAPQVGCWLFLLVPLKLLVPWHVPVPPALASWTLSEWITSSWKEKRSNFRPAPASELWVPRNNALSDMGSNAAEILPQTGPDRWAKSLTGGDNDTDPMSVSAFATPSSEVSIQQRSAITVSASLLLLWVVVVLGLTVRLFCRQVHFWHQLRIASPMNLALLSVDFSSLCIRARVNRPVRLIESADIAAPAVWGTVTPTIILPRGLAASLTRKQLKWALLHELAHVRRHDLLVIWLERAATILHFFNPAIWIAGTVISRLREYACDDFARNAAGISGIQAGEAFFHLLCHVNRRHRKMEFALGIFGFDSLASCKRRVQRMLDSDSKPILPPGWRSVCMILLLAALVLPNLRAVSEAQAPPGKSVIRPNSPATASSGDEKGPAAASQKSFEFLVMGPDDKPIPEIEVEIRSKPLVTAEQIVQGKFLKAGNYGPCVQTDAKGRLVITLPSEIERLSLSITAPGYGPYWAEWNSRINRQPIPAKFTAQLEPAWSVGGIIVDEQGVPVEGAEVHPNIRFKKRQGDEYSLGIGDLLTTDASGRWRFDSVPVSMSEVGVEITHPSFMRAGRGLPRSQFGIQTVQQPTERIALSRGLTVTGKVTDERGEPIEGALVRTKFVNDIREATTDKSGIYKLIGCETGMAKIVVSAKGRATDMQEVRTDVGLKPVDFHLPPGGKVRIRVLDEQGKPVAKARIFFQQWRGRFQYFEFNHVSQYADDNGVWQWNEAPLDTFLADICRPEGMQLGRQSLLASDEEYVFRVPPALVINGKVIDAETREPVKSFRVIPGVRSSASHMNWVPGETFAGSDGQFMLRQTHDALAHLVKVEASGYLAAESREIKSNEGTVSIEFSLKKGRDIAATVLTPKGQSAANAQIALGTAGSQISISNGEFDGQTYATRGNTDHEGRFSFPAQMNTFQLVILHSSGYAHIKSTGGPIPETIPLTAWSRVEGTFRIGDRLVLGVPITINVGGLHSYGENVPSIFTHHDVTTGAGGRFIFERVIPGNASIGRRMMLTVENGATDVTSSIMYPATFKPGETTQEDLGGTGTPVIGKLQPPAKFKDPVLWNFVMVTARLDFPAALRSASPHITASLDRDGNFRIDDMPAGEYRLSVRADRQPVGKLADYRFLIPDLVPGQAGQLIDLGILKLE